MTFFYYRWSLNSCGLYRIGIDGGVGGSVGPWESESTAILTCEPNSNTPTLVDCSDRLDVKGANGAAFDVDEGPFDV